MIYKITEIYSETLRQNDTSEISYTDYNPQSLESKFAYAVAIICGHLHCSQENGDTSVKSEGCHVV
jgi:hypothetical protein